jgi:hypothetical protein
MIHNDTKNKINSKAAEVIELPIKHQFTMHQDSRYQDIVESVKGSIWKHNVKLREINQQVFIPFTVFCLIKFSNYVYGCLLRILDMV